MAAQHAACILLEKTAAFTRLCLTDSAGFVQLQAAAPGTPDYDGAVLCGRVRDVLPGMSAAYLEAGLERPVYLPLKPGERPRSGELLTVTVAAQPGETHKGLRVTRGAALAGRFWLYRREGMGEPVISVSRRLPPEQQQTLRETLLPLAQPGEHLILRTQAAGIPVEKLAAELALLRPQYDDLPPPQRPGVLHMPDPLQRFLYTHHRPGMAVRCAGQAAQGAALSAGLEAGEVSLETENLFWQTGADTAFASVFEAEIPLSCGGRLTVESTRGATVMDVDTAQYITKKGDDGMRLHTQAVRGALRAARQRELSGAILLDLPSVSQLQAAQLLELARETAASDPTPTQIYPLTTLGFLEISRARRRRPVAQQIGMAVPGGMAPTPAYLAHTLLQRVRGGASENRWRITAPAGVLRHIQAAPESAPALAANRWCLQPGRVCAAEAMLDGV